MSFKSKRRNWLKKKWRRLWVDRSKLTDYRKSWGSRIWISSKKSGKIRGVLRRKWAKFIKITTMISKTIGMNTKVIDFYPYLLTKPMLMGHHISRTSFVVQADYYYIPDISFSNKILNNHDNWTWNRWTDLQIVTKKHISIINITRSWVAIPQKKIAWAQTNHYS